MDDDSILKLFLKFYGGTFECDLPSMTAALRAVFDAGRASQEAAAGLQDERP